MARAVTDKRRNLEANSFKKVVDEICSGQYVLLLGSDIILNADANDENAKAKGDLTRFWLNRVIRKRREDGICYPDAETFQKFIINNGLAAKDVRSWLFDALATIDLERNDFNPDIVRLLATKFFRVVLTTVFDPSIEMLMNEVWGKRNYRVKSIYGNKNDTDFEMDEVLVNEYDEIQPILYYVFGRADCEKEEQAQKFVLEDNDTLECISKWLNNEAPPNLLSYIKSKKLLALGCNLKDWCFRFFWYALRPNNELDNGDIALQLETDKSEQDRNLYDYLNKTIKVRVQTDSRKYIHRLAEALNEKLIANTDLSNSQKGGVFISYASEDFAIARYVFTRLTESGFKVWLDNKKLSVSDEYEKRILDAIAQCKVFIPLLTPNVAAYLKADEYKFFRKEWDQATREYNNIKVFPIVTDGYDYKADYHNKVPDKMHNVTVFDWTNDSFENFINAVKKIL